TSRSSTVRAPRSSSSRGPSPSPRVPRPRGRRPSRLTRPRRRPPPTAPPCPARASAAGSEETDVKRHPLDLLSLIAGVMFVGFGALFLFNPSGVAAVSLGSVIPLLVLGGGVALLASLLPTRRDPDDS